MFLVVLVTYARSKPVNTKGAAAYLNCSESFLDRAAINKTGPAFRWIGSRREYDAPDLDAYKRETRVEPRRSIAVQAETQPEI